MGGCVLAIPNEALFPISQPESSGAEWVNQCISPSLLEGIANTTRPWIQLVLLTTITTIVTATIATTASSTTTSASQN